MADFRSRRWAAWWPWPLTFRPLNGVTGHPCHRLPSLSIFTFLRPSILDLGSGTGQIDRPTDRRRPSMLYAQPYGSADTISGTKQYAAAKRYCRTILTADSTFMTPWAGLSRRFLSAVVELADEPVILVTWQSVPVCDHVHVRTGEDRRQTAHLPTQIILAAFYTVSQKYPLLNLL